MEDTKENEHLIKHLPLWPSDLKAIENLIEAQEQQQQTIQELAETLNEAASLLDYYTPNTVWRERPNEFKALAAQHLKDKKD